VQGIPERSRSRAALGLAALLVVVVVLLLPASPVAALPSAPSAQVVAEPSPVLGTDKQRHLVYEILLENRADVSVTIDRLVVRDAATREKVASFGPEALAALVLVVDAPGATTTLPPGSTAFAFLDVRLPPHGSVPKALTHRLTLSLQRPGRPPHRLIVEAAPTGVDRRSPIVVGPPLGGGNLLVADGCCSRGVHAHSLVPVDDHWVNAQRYAIDWLRLDETMSTTSIGDPTSNESYLIWGADVLAVAPGTIVATRDGIADNTPPLDPPPLPLDDLAGNRVVQDLGGGRFALYAHMQNGSVRVRVGDHVQRGDVLGLVGNSGGSNEPHLHFQVTDGAGGPSAVAANALPYVFDKFRLQGTIPDLANPEIVPPAPPPVRTRQLPLMGDIQDFGP
jgi:Peptidase family M23